MLLVNQHSAFTISIFSANQKSSSRRSSLISHAEILCNPARNQPKQAGLPYARALHLNGGFMRTKAAPVGWGWTVRAGVGLLGVALALSSNMPGLRAQSGSVG